MKHPENCFKEAGLGYSCFANVNSVDDMLVLVLMLRCGEIWSSNVYMFNAKTT